MNGLQLLLANVFATCQHALCYLLSRAASRREKNITKPMRILLLRTSALGDFLFAVPAMVQVRERFPDAKIVLLTATTTSSVQSAMVQTYAGADAMPWLSFMIPSVVDEAVCIHSFGLKTLLSVIKKRVLEFNPDAAVILAHPGESGTGLFKKIIFLWLVGVGCRIYGWRTRASTSWFRRAQYEAGLFDHHVVGPLMSVAELPGMPRLDGMKVTFPLHLDPTAQPWADELWRKRGWVHGRIVAVAPGSVQPHKRWPIERFVALCQELVRHCDVNIVVIGTAADKLLGERLVEAVLGDVLNLAGDTTLSQSAAVLERCTLLVGNDGGAMHLGSAMGCPAVSIVPGIEYPDSIEPWFSRDLAVRHPVSCAPCYSFTHCPMKHNKCMAELPVADVYERCLRVLGRAIVSEAMS